MYAKSILYKFVRTCLNRAYVSLDDSKLSAEDKHALDVVMSRIRDAESKWRDVDDLISFLQSELLKIYEDACKRLSKDVVDKLFLDTLELCLELDEVKRDARLESVMRDLVSKLRKSS